MNIPSVNETTSEERTWAALTHISVVLFAWGFVFPLMIWAAYRKKSAFVTFHALQALTYQLFEIPFWIIWAIIISVFLTPLFAVGIAAVSQEADDLPVFLPYLMQLGLFGSLFCGLGMYFLPGLLGTILIFARRDFSYPLLGKWLKRYLSAESSA